MEQEGNTRENCNQLKEKPDRLMTGGKEEEE
jgi:hypothetical protein